MYYFVSYRCTGTKLDVSWEWVFRGLESSSVKISGKGPVCNYLLQTNGFHVRGGDPSDLRMSMKNSPPVNQRTGRFPLSDYGGPVDNDSASCFVWNNTCHRSTGVVRGFLRSIVCCESEKDSLTEKPHRCNCDQRWHKSSIHMVGGKNEVDTITQKKSNGTLLIQLQHSPYSFFLNPLLSGCKLFWDFFSSFLKLKLTQKLFSVYKITMCKNLKKG